MKPIFYGLSAVLVFGLLSVAVARAPSTAKIVFT